MTNRRGAGRIDDGARIRWVVGPAGSGRSHLLHRLAQAEDAQLVRWSPDEELPEPRPDRLLALDDLDVVPADVLRRWAAALRRGPVGAGVIGVCLPTVPAPLAPLVRRGPVIVPPPIDAAAVAAAAGEWAAGSRTATALQLSGGLAWLALGLAEALGHQGDGDLRAAGLLRRIQAALADAGPKAAAAAGTGHPGPHALRLEACGLAVGGIVPPVVQALAAGGQDAHFVLGTLGGVEGRSRGAALAAAGRTAAALQHATAEGDAPAARLLGALADLVHVEAPPRTRTSDPCDDLTRALLALADGDPLAARRAVADGLACSGSGRWPVVDPAACAALIDQLDPMPGAVALAGWIGTAGRTTRALQALSADPAVVGPPAGASPDPALDPLEAILRAGRRAAWARREGDLAAQLEALAHGEAAAVWADADLRIVPVLGELEAAARRSGDPAPALADLTARVTGGTPVHLLGPLHWVRLQSGAAAGQVDPEDVALLQKVADRLPTWGVVAAAAACWHDVVEHGVRDLDRVQEAVAALVRRGWPFEGALLAGHAALRAEDPADVRLLLEEARRAKRGPGTKGATAGLTGREADVAALLLQGLTHRAIGAELYLSPKTVEHHVAAIRAKLGAGNRADLLARLRTALGS